MLAIFNSLLPIFLLILLGFGLRKGGMVPAEQWRGVELIAYWLLFPALLITTLVRSDVSFTALAGYAQALLWATLIMCLVMWLARRPLHTLMGVKGPAYTSIFQTATRWHGFIAFAVVDKLYGAHGLAVLAIAFAIMVPILNVVNILILTVYTGQNRPTAAMIGRNLLRNPLMWGIFVGLVLKLTQVLPPPPFMTLLDLLGRGALGVSLLALGAGLRWQALKQSGREVAVAVVAKLFLWPATAFAMALIFDVSGETFVIMMIAAAVPTAVNGYVLARAMGGDAELYAAASTAQVLLSFLTLPLVILLAQGF